MPSDHSQLVGYQCHKQVGDYMRTKYTEKIGKMHRHLQDNPHDYQTVISYLETRSKDFDEQRKMVMDGQYKLLAKYKKESWKHDEQ